jgi:FAD/FMN-containing dehydrogenase
MNTEKERTLKELEKIVGTEHVSADLEDCIAYSRDQISPFMGTCLPDYVVRPGSVEEIQDVVRFANENKIRITPYCWGTNVGGLTLAPGGILLDLRRLNKIIEINKNSMTATVEPAVTFGALRKEAKKKGLDIIAIIGPYTGTIIGNYLAANIKLHAARYGLDPILSLEVVLPSGELLRTGSAAFPGHEKINPYFRYAFGPDITGLFRGSMGSFGIITKATVSLYPVGECRESIHASFAAIEPALIAMQQTQKLDIGKWLIIHNNTAMACMTADIKQLTDPAEIRKVREEWPPFVMSIGLEGTAEQVEVEKKLIEKIVSNEGGKIFQLPKKFEKAIEEEYLPGGKIRNNRLLVPHGTCRWADCYIPVYKIPALIEAIVSLIEKFDIKDPVTKELQIPPKCNIVPVDRGRTALIFFTIDCDPFDNEALGRIDKFFPRWMDAVARFGGSSSMLITLDRLSSEYAKIIRTIKKMLDPNGIFRPVEELELYE